MKLAAVLTLLRWWRVGRRPSRPCDYCTARAGRGHDFDCETRQR